MKVHHTEMAECTCCIAALIEPLAAFQLAVTEPQEGDEGMIAYIGARDAIHGVVLSLLQAAIEQEREANAILVHRQNTGKWTTMGGDTAMSQQVGLSFARPSARRSVCKPQQSHD